MDTFITRLKYLIATIIFIESIVIITLPPAIAIGNPLVRFISLFILVVTSCYIILLIMTSKWFTRRLKSKYYNQMKNKREQEKYRSKKNLATQLMTKLTFNGRFKPFLPVVGFIVIILDILYNASFNNFNFGETDTTAFLFSIMLIIYHFIDDRFAWERDFMMIFSIVLVLILIIPLMITRALQGDPDSNVNMYSRIMLGPPLVFVLNIIGISAQDEGTSSNGYPMISYSDINGTVHHIGISATCAGLYSFSIFVGLFSAFVLVQYSRLNLKISFLLILGFLTSYLANIFRMVIIVMVGYYYGLDPVVWLTHEYAGLLIFLLWLAIFWFFLLKYINIEKSILSYKTDNVEKKGKN